MDLQKHNFPDTRVLAFASVEAPTFEFKELTRVIRTRWKIILSVAAAVTAVALLGLLLITPQYTATAVVLLDDRPNKVVDSGSVVSRVPTDPASIESQIEILRSRGFLGRVAETLHLNRDPEFVPSSGSFFDAVLGFHEPSPADVEDKDTIRDLVVGNMLARLTVTAQGLSKAIQIRFNSISAPKAALISNAIADAYAEDQLRTKLDTTQRTGVWLADQVRQLSAQAQTAETALQQYLAQHNLAETGAGSGTVIEQQLGQLNAQLSIAKADLAQQESKYALMLQLQKTGHAADVTEVVASPLISQLRTQEAELVRQVAELSSIYGPAHPKMIDIAAQKRNLETKIGKEVQRVVQTVSNDVSVGRARVNSLQESVDALTKSSAGATQAKAKLGELRAVASSSRSSYETVLSKFKEMQGQEEIQKADVRVISRAEVPKSVAFPKKTLVIGAALPGGLFLGLLVALLSERLNGGFRTRSEVEGALGLPVLAILPEIRTRKKSVADWVIDKPLSSFSEAARWTLFGLDWRNAGDKPKVVLVTSALPNEGKTTLAVNLARMAARRGKKVLLLECDLRRPSIQRMMGLTRVSNGVLEALSRQVTLADCYSKDMRSDLTVLPALCRRYSKSNLLTFPAARQGGVSPSDLACSREMEQLLIHARAEFHLVVIDSAPLLTVTDSRILAKLADAVLLAIRWEKTPREAAVEAVYQIATSGTRASVVLTRADDRRCHYYNYGSTSYTQCGVYYSN